MPGIASLKRDTTREILQRCTKLEYAVAVVFECRLFSTKDCMRPCTESMKRRTDEGRTIHIYILYIIIIYIYYILHALLYRLCGARSGSPQLICVKEAIDAHLEAVAIHYFIYLKCNIPDMHDTSTLSVQKCS